MSGYSDERARNIVTEPILDRWVGWKVIIYDMQVNNETAVKLESYLDNHNNDSWEKVTEIIDIGGWYSRSTDEKILVRVVIRRETYYSHYHTVPVFVVASILFSESLG